MKPAILGLPRLGLIIAALACGASTIYLAIQLREERIRGDQFIEESRALQARIAELEKARAQFGKVGSAGGTAPAGDAAPTRQVEPPEVGKLIAAPVAAPEVPPSRAGMPPAERSEALQKLMRSQLRTTNQRLHADIGDRLGLSREQANKLIDLLTDQQIAAMQRARERMSNANGDTQGFENARDKELAEVAGLIGHGKLAQFEAYQETLPARQEVEMLSRQLNDADMALSRDQRNRMVEALAEERQRVPAPRHSDAASREEHLQAMAAWQEDYNQRAASRARSILHSDQLSAYAEYQQLSRDLRQQLEARN
jgi:hypothetical protein